MVKISIYVCLILIREYIFENYYALEFMRQKFHELLERSKLKIARCANNPNVQKQNFWKLKLEWQTLKMKMKINLVSVTCVKVVLFEKWQFSALTRTDS